MKQETSRSDTEERELEKRKRYFFQRLFYGSRQENGAIANEVIRLCNILPPQYTEHCFDVKNALLDEARANQYSRELSLSDVYNNLHDQHLLTTYDEASFIAIELPHTSDDIDKYDQYKALALLTVAHLHFLDDFQGRKGKRGHRSKIEDLCNELRQYANGARKQLVAYLPSITLYDMQGLIDVLRDLEKHDKLKGTNIIGRLANYRRAFENSYLEEKGRTRQVQSKEFRKDGELKVINKQYLDDDGSTSLTEVKGLRFENKVRGSSSWFEEEELSTPSKTVSMVSSSAFIKNDYAVQALQARAISEKFRKNSMQLSCDTYSMTSTELRNFVAACIKSLRDDDEFREAARVLLLMLLTGNTLAEIRKWKEKKNDRRRIIGIERKFELPSHKVRDELKQLTRSVSSLYTLPLPLNLVSDLKNFKFAGLEEQDLRDYLSQVKRHFNINITMKKVSSYLIQVLKANGVDCTIADLITGTDAKNQPARYYTYIPGKTLYDVFGRYLSHVNHADQTDYLLDLEYVEPDFGLGSPLFVDFNILQSLFSQLRDELEEEINTGQETRYSEQTHNLCVLYMQLILGLMSGYRPVEGWFGSVDDIHFATGEYRIAEKERATGYSGRTIILPPTALNVLQDYLAYCEESAIYFAHHDSELSKRYKFSLNGDMPFCFYRYQENVQEVSPSSYMQHISLIFPFPDNWTRHYLRSFLFSKGISDELIGAWMGHIHSDQLPFAQFSQLRRKDLQVVCDLLESHITLLLGVST